jgi:anaerobic ribonucleoside-triphosphate reductase activating protein
MSVNEWINYLEETKAYGYQWLNRVGRLAAINQKSRSCGPLDRTEIFFQGCDRHCNGCFSPGTCDPHGGQVFYVREVLNYIFTCNDTGNNLFRVSICGGEPFMQPDFLAALLAAIRQYCKDTETRMTTILLYTGHSFDEISHESEILDLVDMLVTEPYVQELHCMSPERKTDFIGSDNQKFMLWFKTDDALIVNGESANKMMSYTQVAFDIEIAIIYHRREKNVYEG